MFLLPSHKIIHHKDYVCMYNVGCLSNGMCLARGHNVTIPNKAKMITDPETAGEFSNQ